jgi:hypothetical protein
MERRVLLHIIHIEGHHLRGGGSGVIGGAHGVHLALLIDLPVAVVIHTITGLVEGGEGGPRGAGDRAEGAGGLAGAHAEPAALSGRGGKALISAPVTVLVDEVTRGVTLKGVRGCGLTAHAALHAERGARAEPKAARVREILI